MARWVTMETDNKLLESIKLLYNKLDRGENVTREELNVVIAALQYVDDIYGSKLKLLGIWFVLSAGLVFCSVWLFETLIVALFWLLGLIVYGIFSQKEHGETRYLTRIARLLQCKHCGKVPITHEIVHIVEELRCCNCKHQIISEQEIQVENSDATERMLYFLEK